MGRYQRKKIFIGTGYAGHCKVFLGAANVPKHFEENELWVELYYDAERRAIGFKPVSKRTRMLIGSSI